MKDGYTCALLSCLMQGCFFSGVTMRMFAKMHFTQDN